MPTHRTSLLKLQCSVDQDLPPAQAEAAVLGLRKEILGLGVNSAHIDRLPPQESGAMGADLISDTLVVALAPALVPAAIELFKHWCCRRKNRSVTVTAKFNPDLDSPEIVISKDTLPCDIQRAIQEIVDNAIAKKPTNEEAKKKNKEDAGEYQGALEEREGRS